jgi:hypothetical protein
MAELLATVFAATSRPALGAAAHAAAAEEFRNADIVAANEQARGAAGAVAVAGAGAGARAEWKPARRPCGRAERLLSPRPGRALAQTAASCCPPAPIMPQVVLIGPFTPGDPGNRWLPELDADVQALWWAAGGARCCGPGWNGVRQPRQQVQPQLGPAAATRPPRARAPSLPPPPNPHRADAEAMGAAAGALELYRRSTESLVHNDLHCGNLLVAPGRGLADNSSSDAWSSSSGGGGGGGGGGGNGVVSSGGNGSSSRGVEASSCGASSRGGSAGGGAADSLWVIDLEMATFGPPSYDLGCLSASLLLAAIAARLGGLPEPGGAGSPGGRGGGGGAAGARIAPSRAAQAAWLLRSVEELWAATLDAWWARLEALDAGGGANGGGGAGGAGGGSGGSTCEGRAAWEARVVAEGVAFMGVCTARLVVGHSYALFARLRDRAARARCEAAALRAGRALLRASVGAGGGVAGALALVERELAAAGGGGV